MTTLAAADGTPLQLRAWPAAAAHGPARGHVHLVHGLGEHSGRYDALAQALNTRGFAVSAHDHRGHGRSGGPRGAIPADDTLCADLALVLDRVRPPAGRLVLLGHSLGGLVAARFVAETLAAQPRPWSRQVDALVLSSPALDPGMTAVQKLLLATAIRVAPDAALGNGLQPARISRDPAVVEAYRRDPLVHDRVTPRLARFVVDAGRLVLASAPRWTTRTLLLWAGADRCVAPRGSAAFAAAAPPDVVEHAVYPALAHELFNEPERDQVIARLARFLEPL